MTMESYYEFTNEGGSGLQFLVEETDNGVVVDVSKFTGEPDDVEEAPPVRPPSTDA